MNLVLQREVLTSESTIGRLSVENEHICFTLEDVVRVDGVKVFGETAIPANLYKVGISRSARFGKELPILYDVPGFTGIRIHAGNTKADTHGCILVGLTKGKDSIGQSRAAMEKLQPLIQEALDRGEEVWLDIRNPEKE